jgi:hypothetical protein
MTTWQDLLDYLPTTDRLLYWLAIVVLGFCVAQLSAWLSQRIVQGADDDDTDDADDMQYESTEQAEPNDNRDQSHESKQ